jgi:hypothetical protein
VNVEYGVHYDPEEVVINRMIGLEKMSKDSYAVTNSGFKLYKFGSNGISPELYVKAIGGDVKFHFICNTIERVPYPSCTVFSNIDENLHIQYYFPRKYIDTAYEEYIKIINLVNSFAEN